MRDERDIRAALDRYGDTIRRICFLHLKNHHDAKDIFQDVFLKYALHNKTFESEAHEKAWLIRVAINACKDILKSYRRRNVSSLETLITEPAAMDDESRGLLREILALPYHYRMVIYMFYYEGYSAVEIAELLGKKENTIYTWMARAREQLRIRLEGESNA